MKELQINESKIKITQGSIEFPDYKSIKCDADQLAVGLKSVHVTPETLKANKKLLAAVNKQVDKLESFRKNTKKSLLEPYEEFNSQIKSITDSVNEAKETIKTQENEIEEIERQGKRKEIVNLFNLRIQMYSDFPFKIEDFLSAQGNVLNKSMTLNKAESLMASWFEQKQADIDVIKKMPDSNKIMTQYLINPESLAETILKTQKEEEYEKKAKELAKKSTTVDFDNYSDVNVNSTFIIYGEVSIKKLKTFMNASNINYKEI